MKEAVRDLTDEQIWGLCSKQDSCKNCPLEKLMNNLCQKLHMYDKKAVIPSNILDTKIEIQ